MKLDSTFTVTAPIEEVWKTLMDFQEVAGCLPGAQVLNQLSADAYQVAMKVKLGPVTMAYKGQLEVLERDPVEHRAVLTGQAKETRGQGTAQATATLRLVEDGPLTRGTVSADVALSGRAAAMGQSVVGKVTDQRMAQFASNLQAMLNAGGATHPVPLADDEVPDELASAPQGPVGQEATLAAATDDSVDALALARSMALAQLESPQRAVPVLLVAALVVYRLGQRSGRREARRWSVVPR